MNVLIILAPLVFVFVSSQDKLNDECKTPEYKDGVCIPLSSCDIVTSLIKASRKGNRTAFGLATAYQCGYDDGILVCCDLNIANDNLFSHGLLINPSTIALQPIVLKNFNSTDLPDRSVCGLNPSDNNRVEGGEETAIGDFAWVAAIEFVRKKDNTNVGVQCGGSLINDRYVLTAAHCMQDLQLKIHKVRLGEWNIKTDPDCYEDLPIPECADNVQIYGVEKQIVHEYYSRRLCTHDVGLLKLDKSVQYTTYIRPICLPPPGMPLIELQTYMTVVGWGLTENGSTSDFKLKVNVPLVSNSVCREKITTFPITRHHYCAGGQDGKDAFRGDSGGPLMRRFQNEPYGEERWFLEGIVGFGLGCGNVGVPAIYLRVTDYTNWIMEKLTEERARPRTAQLDRIAPAFYQSVLPI